MSRQQLILVGVLIVVVIGAAGFGLALAVSHLNQGSTVSVTSTPTAIPTVATTNGKKGNKERRVTGVIQSLGTQSFVLSNGKKKNATITVMVDSQTKYTGAGGSASFSDLKLGETVEVRGMYDSQAQTLQATEVNLSPSSGGVTPTP